MEPQWREVWARLDIGYDDYIRTTEARHAAAVAKLLQAVHDNGRDDIYLGTYEGLYCVSCEAYYVEADLLEGGLCPIHERPVERMTEENYFFRLSAYADRLLEHYERTPTAVEPDTRRNEVLSVIRGGLQDFSISRTTFDWGIPIPWDPKHVTYVWFDALTNYITAAGYADDPERFARMWPANIHMIGKDILRFHAIYWPAMLMAAGVEPPTQVWAHGFLTVGGKKMSKTNLTGIHPFELLDQFGVDSYRYYFMREMPFGQDGSFSWESMIERHNADLANGLGNLASRVLAMLGVVLRRESCPRPRTRVRRRTCRRSPRTRPRGSTRTCSGSSCRRRSPPCGTSWRGRTATWSRRSRGSWRRTRRTETSSRASCTPRRRRSGSWPSSSRRSCLEPRRSSGRSSVWKIWMLNASRRPPPGEAWRPAPRPRKARRSSPGSKPSRVRASTRR